MKFSINIDEFIQSSVSRGNEITVEHEYGQPFTISLVPALIPFITDPIALNKYIGDAAMNNWESCKDEKEPVSVTIHITYEWTLKQRLAEVSHDTIMGRVVSDAALNEPLNQVCWMIYQQGCDNEKMMREIIGSDLYDEVIEFISKQDISVL